MKILHITDSHGTVKGPESRRDVYYISFLKKMYELGFVVKQQKIDMVVHTGDLFHTARVSDKFAGQVSEMIKAMNVPFYVVPGNHDIEGYTIDTIDQTKLGLLAKTGVITLLDRDNPIRLECEQDGEQYSVAISGQEYYKNIDEGNMQDFEMQQDDADLNILAIHGYITDTPQHPNIKCTMCQDIVSDADIILTGHYHRQFEWSDGQNLDIYNPGSMMRVEQTEYNKTHTPMYGILDIGLDNQGRISWQYDFHEFRIAQPSTVVFDYSSKYKAKQTSITLDGFKNSIANTMSQVNTSSNDIIQIIDDVCSQGNVDKAIQHKCEDIYNNALQITPDEFEAQPGFIEAQQKKKIVKVILDNFQSHEHTEMNFTDGLNIIVGESNNGKTAVLRGIMWAITNQPLGTDFIMAGKDECSVTICYDDGTSIKRGRTLKDTGYYDIYYRDDNGTLQRGQYRGFTNAVPVEVANVHQMPKVSITKDIETHLNVLSQLDGPFLLTESPMTKAAAIGRITGTHVIDAGIKESNKTIQNNRKVIKTYESDISEKRNVLQNMPDVSLMEQVSVMYNAIVDYMKNIQNQKNTIANYVKQITDLDTKINTEQQQYEKYCALNSIAPLVNTGISKLQFIKDISAKLVRYNNTTLELTKQEKVLFTAKPYVEIKPIVEKIFEECSNTLSLHTQFERANNASHDYAMALNHSLLVKEYNKTLKGIMVHFNILHDYCAKLQPKLDSMSELDKKINEANNAVVNAKRAVKSVKTQLTKTQNEKNQFIVDNGICPCCGQSINNTHVSSITSFMEAL